MARMQIGKQIRHIHRYRDIAAALIRHGFGFIVEETELFQMLSLPARVFREPRVVERKSIGERLRHVIQDLGPTCIKLGQIASTRSDVIPEDIIRELEKLQDQVEPVPYPDVLGIMETVWGRKLETVFSAFEETPLAAASIGQVHAAVLQTGERVAVKIQRPGIGEKVRTDLEILQHLALLAENRFGWARRFQLQRMMEEFGKSLLEELDYTIEGKNTERIAKQFAKDDTVYIPRIHRELTTKKTLVMEYIEGIKVSHIEELAESGYESKKVAERLVRAVLQQIFIDGFFHADPHPGNLMVLPEERIVFLDFGLVGRLTPDMKQNFASLIIALMQQSTEGVVKAVLRMGLVTDEVDLPSLRADVDLLREKYYGVPFSELSLGEAVTDLLDTAYRHHIRIPTDLILLGKALLTVEGVIVKLDSDISIVTLAEPFGRRLLLERLHPMKIGERLWKDASAFGQAMMMFPKQVTELLDVVKNGRTRIEINVPELDIFLRKLDRISNRLSFSIVLLSFSIMMMGLIIGSSLSRQPSLVWNVPAIEIGFVIAMLMSVWLLFAIFKSGRF
jgi:ubiquinone biosynthesis protein